MLLKAYFFRFAVLWLGAPLFLFNDIVNGLLRGGTRRSFFFGLFFLFRGIGRCFFLQFPTDFGVAQNMHAEETKGEKEKQRKKTADLR